MPRAHILPIFRLTLVFHLFCALISGCNKSDSASSAANPYEASDSPEARMDRQGDQIIASNTKAEAREWLKQPNHLFFKADPKSASTFVEEFYKAGATKVYIADLEDHDGNQYGGSILVLLPNDSDEREKLFDIGMRADIVYGQDPVIDRGQRYLCYTPD